MARRFRLSSGEIGNNSPNDYSAAGASSHGGSFYKATGARHNRMEPGFCDGLGHSDWTGELMKDSKYTGSRFKDPINIGKTKPKSLIHRPIDESSDVGKPRRKHIRKTHPDYATSNLEYGRSDYRDHQTITPPAGMLFTDILHQYITEMS